MSTRVPAGGTPAASPTRATLPRETSGARWWWRAYLAAFVAWTLFGLGYAQIAQWTQMEFGRERVAPFLHLLYYTLPISWLWAAMTPPILLLSRSLPLFGRHALRNGVLLLLAAVVAHAISSALEWWVLVEWLRRPGGPRTPAGMLLSGVFFNFFRFGMVAMLGQAFEQARRRDRQRNELLRLRAELGEAQLEVLKLQLQPHFLFNALNAIAELVHSDPARAERAIVKLGDLLRLMLARLDRRETTLAEELEFLAPYAELERMRSGDRVRVATEADSAALDAAVPTLVLQPLVENALRHGLAGRERGVVRVAAERHDGRLFVRITDDGIGLDPSSLREGVGLRNTRARLRQLFGETATLELVAPEGGGAETRLDLPARPPHV